MSIRQRTFLIIGTTLFALTAFLYVAAHGIILHSFEQLEQQNLERDINRVDKALQDMLDTLAIFNHDWASWDDTYEFIVDRNQEYIDANLLDKTFIGSRLNIMAFVDLEGQVVYGKAFSLDAEAAVALPDEFEVYFTPDHLLNLPDTETGVSGLLNLPEGHVLISSQPITTSEGTGPIRGALIMGRYITNEVIGKLSDITDLNLSITSYDDGAGLPDDLVSAATSPAADAPITAVHVLNSMTIEGYCVVRNIDGTPSLVLRIEEPRAIYNQGRSSLTLFFIAMIGVGLASIAANLLLLERTVLKRLHGLSQTVSRVHMTGDLDLATPRGGGDELTSFANNIQNMLMAMNDYQHRLREANEHLEEEVEARTHELAVTIEQLEAEIHAREEAQAQLAAAHDQAVENAQLKSQILANISHDARTPLSIIVLRTEMLKRQQFGTLTARQEQALDGILASAYEMLGFVNNLLQGSKLDSTVPLNANNSTINPATWLDNFVETVRPLADEKDLELHVEIAPDLVETVETDADWLKHIVTNLANNAIKFTDTGSITIRLRNESAISWAVEVEDTGCGIPEEVHERIFDAFWQVDSSSTRLTNRGIGLGLSIVKQLVDQLGGSITVASTPGQGSTFTFTLPVFGSVEHAQVAY